MPIFAVVTKEPAPQVEERLSDMHPLKISSTVYLVKSESLTEEIAQQAGIKGPDRDVSGGVVLGLEGTYAGFHQQTVWEWLRRYSN